MRTKKPEPVVRKNICQPKDWWKAFEKQAKKSGLSLSAWIGKQALMGLESNQRSRLKPRKAAHRPSN